MKIKIINNESLLKRELYQFRFPKSKKKRIRKKWSKDMKNYRNRESMVLDKENNILYVTKRQYEMISKMKDRSHPIVNKGLGGMYYFGCNM